MSLRGRHSQVRNANRIETLEWRQGTENSIVVPDDSMIVSVLEHNESETHTHRHTLHTLPFCLGGVIGAVAQC